MTCSYTKVTGVTGLRVTDWDSGNNTVINLGDGATMQGGGNGHIFDVGVEIGTSGIGKNDDIRETSFTVMGITYSDIDFIQEFGVRLTTVGIPTARTLSSKVVGLASGCPILK